MISGLKRSLAVEAAVFWLVVTATTWLYQMALSPFYPGYTVQQNLAYFQGYNAAGITIAAVNVILAYSCWRLRRSAFASAIVLNLVVTVLFITGGLAYLCLNPPNGPVPSGFGGGALSAGSSAVKTLASLLAIFYSLRAYRELKVAPPVSG